MTPAVAFAVRYGPEIAPWLLAHSGELGDALGRLTRPVVAAITDPSASLDRVGAALVAQQNGQIEVIGLLHRQSDSLRDVAAAVEGVRAGQQALAGTLGLLTSLSIVGLGVSVLSHAALALQLAALTRRLKAVERTGKQVQGMIRAEHRGQLNAGLTLLKDGLAGLADNPARATRFLDEAGTELTRSASNYAAQVEAEAGSADHAYLWLLARHLTVAALGQAAAHLQASQPALAVRALETALGPLRGHARAVFARTVGADPARFLIPATAAHGITLEAVAELYRQAGHAGAVGAEERLSAADRFEALRGRLAAARDPRFGAAAVVRRLTAAWAEAAAAVEEVNRVKGLALAVGAYHSPSRSYADLAAEILRDMEARRPAADVCLAFFPECRVP